MDINVTTYPGRRADYIKPQVNTAQVEKKVDTPAFVRAQDEVVISSEVQGPLAKQGTSAVSSVDSLADSPSKIWPHPELYTASVNVIRAILRNSNKTGNMVN